VRKTINLTHATSSSSLSPPISLLPQEAGGNAQLSILDAEGNGLSATVSNDFSSSGPGLLVPETGIVLNNTMDDFSAKPGEKNIYGLSGNEGNAVAAKKRPSSSLMPTLIFKSGRPVLALGAGGGPSAISAMLNVTLNVLFIYKDDLKKSVFAPRVYHGWWPDKLEVEAGVGDSTRAELKNFGHEIIPMSTKEMATVEAVSYDAKSGRLTAVFDPRSSGGADAR
jgi:gamma-glutamyltranspeptidase/glutathione hydrolase